MGLIALVFLSALILEGLGSYISIVGLATKTSYIIVAVAVTLDLAKITIASVLYKRWAAIPFFLKLYLLPTLVCLIIFTSFGAFGYLSQEFSKTMLQQEQNTSQIDDMVKEQAKLEARKIEIDKQISQLPAEFVSQRKRLSDMFAPEVQKVQERITQLDKEIPILKAQNIQESGNSGTISSAAKNIGISPESIIRVVSFFLVLFIDPLAIVLLTMGNFLVEQRKKEAKKSKALSDDTQDSLSTDTNTQEPITLSPDDLSTSTKTSNPKKRSKKEKSLNSNSGADNFKNNIDLNNPVEGGASLVDSAIPVVTTQELAPSDWALESINTESDPTSTSPNNNEEQTAELTMSALTLSAEKSANSEAKNNVFTNYIKKEDSILTLSVQDNAQNLEPIILTKIAQSSDTPAVESSDAPLDELEELTSLIVKPKPPTAKSAKIVHAPLENKSNSSPVVLQGQVVQRNNPVGKFDFTSFKEKPPADNSDLAQMEKYIKEKQKRPPIEEDADSSPI